MMIKAAYFPTIIYAKDVNLDNRLFEREVLAWADKDKGVKRTNMNGWHSTTNMHEIPVFKPLVDELFKMQHEPPVRKISMTCLLSPENEFEGGDLELMAEGKVAKIKQGHAVFFASFIRHRVKPVIRGNRKSLVMWFGGTPFK